MRDFPHPLVEVASGRRIVLVSLPTADPVSYRYEDEPEGAERSMSLIQFTGNGWFVAAGPA